MTIQELQDAMKQAMKNKKGFEKNVLSDLLGAVKKAGIDAGCRNDIPESMVDTVILKEQKVAQEMIDTCPQDRLETLMTYVARKKVIDAYAPMIITDEDEIRKMIMAQFTDGVIFTTKGEAMKKISPALKGKVDMKLVSQIVDKMIKEVYG